MVVQVGVLPVVHGSALGQQGHSQALVTVTVGERDEQARFEGITGETTKQLMVQFTDRVATASEEVSCLPVVPAYLPVVQRACVAPSRQLVQLQP